jgi:hypothetical protein
MKQQKKKAEAKLVDYTTAELEAEIKERREFEARAREKARRERAEILLTKVDALLEIVPEHSRTSCSDEQYHNMDRCTRCFLLDVKVCGFWDSSSDLILYIQKT